MPPVNRARNWGTSRSACCPAPVWQHCSQQHCSAPDTTASNCCHDLLPADPTPLSCWSQVFFDIEIGGKPAGRIVMGLYGGEHGGQHPNCMLPFCLALSGRSTLLHRHTLAGAALRQVSVAWQLSRSRLLRPTHPTVSPTRLKQSHQMRCRRLLRTSVRCAPARWALGTRQVLRAGLAGMQRSVLPCAAHARCVHAAHVCVNRAGVCVGRGPGVATPASSAAPPPPVPCIHLPCCQPTQPAPVCTLVLSLQGCGFHRVIPQFMIQVGGQVAPRQRACSAPPAPRPARPAARSAPPAACPDAAVP